MSLRDEFTKMTTGLAARFAIPSIGDVFFPPLSREGQPKDAQFMAISLEGGATGISYVLLPDESMDEYAALRSSEFIGSDPKGYALGFGSESPIEDMISLAAINAICQQVMAITDFDVGYAADSMALLSVSAGDRIGMVGLFSGLVKKIKDAGAELVVIEKDSSLIEDFPTLPITLDATRLNTCNKVICTSTTILNNTLDDILDQCLPDAFVSIIGPTAGYFPDPVFSRGVDVVGGRIVTDGEAFLKRLAAKERWGDVTQRTLFQKDTYTTIV